MDTPITGACVVLIPNHLGIEHDVPGGLHITLAYFGDYNLDESQELELLRIVSKVMNDTEGQIILKTMGVSELGEEGDAIVLLVDPELDAPANTLREEIIDQLSTEMLHIFRKSQTFPTFKPHMTLGYKSKGYVLDAEMPLPEYITVQGMAVWNGESRTMLHNRNDSSIAHYGILRKSGRYPWGSGEDPYQRSKAFYAAYNQLKAEGVSEKDIASYFGEKSTPPNPDFNTSALRATRSLAQDEKRAGDRSTILRWKDKGMGTSEIARRMDMPESTVRSLLKDSVEERINITKVTAEKLRDRIGTENYLDIGKGTENLMGVSPDRLKTAVAILKDEGYNTFNVMTPQLGMPGQFTNTKVLAPPGHRFPDVKANQDKIVLIDTHSQDNGITFEKPGPPQSVKSKRLEVVYSEDGGTLRDGIVELRPGVKDLDLGHNKYGQVRIAVDDTHFIKGVAVYNNDLPKGIDLRFHTNKDKSVPALGPKDNSVLKPLKRDKDGNLDVDAPFGSMIKPGGQRGSINLVNEEGDWEDWSKNFSSQFLSKQTQTLAKRQLDMTYQNRVAELDEINSLTQPTVKNTLLHAFSDNMDSQAVNLKAMGLPRTNNKVIIPFPEMKEGEIYAPTYNNGEKVVLVRHPHGGIFEIPELTVNNRTPSAKNTLGNAADAVGIHPKVAEQLSGADFDGDTVLVIPQGTGAAKIKTSKVLKDLDGFEPKDIYKGYPGMKVMSNTQTEMGMISNLITDMTIAGANDAEIANAVRHSMVVIDAEKHKLNYKQSEIDHGIKRLRKIYQPEGGASTIISRAKSEKRVNKLKPRPAKEGGPIDPKTGAKVFVETGETYPVYETKGKDEHGKPIYVLGEDGRPVVKKIENRIEKRTRMSLVSDANELVSTHRTGIELIYADHANKMKDLANTARLNMINTEEPRKSPTASQAYAPQVESLVSKLNIALQNAPVERLAQIVGNAIVEAKLEANPWMDSDDLKKVRTRALEEARLRTGAKKQQVVITPIEWEAIQAGALSPTRLREVLRHADLDKVKEYATPRSQVGMTPALLARAQAMLANGYPQSEVAAALGVSTSTLTRALK